MGIINSAMRRSIPGPEFGLPAERKYPMPDASHAANAKARASQQLSAGNLSSSQKSAIDAKANRILKKG